MAVISIASTVDRYNDDIHYKNGTHLSAQLSWAATMLAYQSRSPDPAVVGDRWKAMWLERLEGEYWLDCQPAFEDAHFLNGFGHADGRFHFRPDWLNGITPNTPPVSVGRLGPVADLPAFPDQLDVIETADADHPFRLATSPARNFLNSSFAETKTSRQKEGRPEVMVNPAKVGALACQAGGKGVQ